MPSDLEVWSKHHTPNTPHDIDKATFFTHDNYLTMNLYADGMKQIWIFLFYHVFFLPASGLSSGRDQPKTHILYFYVIGLHTFLSMPLSLKEPLRGKSENQDYL